MAFHLGHRFTFILETTQALGAEPRLEPIFVTHRACPFNDTTLVEFSMQKRNLKLSWHLLLNELEDI